MAQHSIRFDGRGSRRRGRFWPSAAFYGLLDFLAGASYPGCPAVAPRYWRTECRLRREARHAIAELERLLAGGDR